MSLVAACLRGDVETLSDLLAADADPSAEDVDGRSVLFVSCMCDQPECAALVLAAGAGIDQPMREPNPGATPLYVAAMCGHERCVRLLCENGCPPPQRGGPCSTPA
ncbi:hypothetical protein EMIHUDRAFT_206074 [Emiliania huxleyi CCMP1516]|uniref:Ankyrin repeat domain-containing protein n=2 Tax=Emiliania huxleyi TaxID=2903 RepID=A0A0D3JQT5_EMIH1|nr:hypothetical protein EMIHUDRAFT_206074 [Emiliania huxleyi CCMP1516]EOD25870.1 hypothetical protein EMIHUDRAFT_206074 [Emiliania huxleyi CCMP1516]|eukprot:XP_005778299.1 hypothetical protein EMIHUDRAFT_206074 [Emiliania huxleyi CCMP1516]